MNVFITNKTTGATTKVRVNSRGDVLLGTWKRALRRIQIVSASEINAECRHEFVCSANTGKVLAVRFAGAAS